MKFGRVRRQPNLQMKDADSSGAFDCCFEVRIRPCRRTDLEALEWNGLHRDDRKIITATFQKHMRGRQHMIVAEANRMPVGQVWLDLEKCAGENAGFVWALRVVPWLRGLGIGSRLLRQAEQAATERGRAAVRLTVDEPNHRALSLYERRGYRVVNRVMEFEPYRTRAGRLVRLRRPRLVMEKPVSISQQPT